MILTHFFKFFIAVTGAVHRPVLVVVPPFKRSPKSSMIVKNHFFSVWFLIFDFWFLICSCYVDVRCLIKRWGLADSVFTKFFKWTLLSTLISFFSKQITFLVSVFRQIVTRHQNRFWLFFKKLSPVRTLHRFENDGK